MPFGYDIELPIMFDFNYPNDLANLKANNDH